MRVDLQPGCLRLLLLAIKRNFEGDLQPGCSGFLLQVICGGGLRWLRRGLTFSQVVWGFYCSQYKGIFEGDLQPGCSGFLLQLICGGGLRWLQWG